MAQRTAPTTNFIKTPAPASRKFSDNNNSDKLLAAMLAKPIEDVTPIAKPDTAFNLDKFKSKHAAAVANVETLQTGLPHHSIAQAKDFVRLHPSEETYWSQELCFVNVPIKGQKKDALHLIYEDLAMRYLPSGRILRFRLVLATKPYDVFFLCHLPTRNTDNSWNESNTHACQQAKTSWVQATSRREEGVDGYKIDVARDHDAFLSIILMRKWHLLLSGLTTPSFRTLTDSS